MEALILPVLATIATLFGLLVIVVGVGLWLLWRAGGREMQEGRR